MQINFHERVCQKIFLCCEKKLKLKSEYTKSYNHLDLEDARGVKYENARGVKSGLVIYGGRSHGHTPTRAINFSGV